MPYARLFKILRPKTENISTKSVTETEQIGIERVTLSPIRDINAALGGAVTQTVRVFDFSVENYKADIQHGDILESAEGEEQSFRITDIRLHDLGQNQRLIGSANLVR